jgi:beta-phosphoglucomutase-like phosphatase (HAD superfamily)
MDGVIADFEKRYKELYHMAPKEAESKKEFYKFFDEFIATQQFASLDLMPGAAEGLEYLRKANVLTQMLTSSASEKRHDR